MINHTQNLIAQANKKIPLGEFNPPTDAFSAGSQTSADKATSNLELFISNTVGFVTVLASIFFIGQFILAAFNWVTSGGDSSKVQKARDKMVQGVLGLIIIISSYALLGLIGNVIGLDLLNIGDQIQKLNPIPTP